MEDKNLTVNIINLLNSVYGRFNLTTAGNMIDLCFILETLNILSYSAPNFILFKACCV